jgi:hypothetical protein
MIAARCWVLPRQALPDSAGLLQGKGRYVRHVKLKPGTAVDASSMEALITVAYVEIRTRLGPQGAAFAADAEFDRDDEVLSGTAEEEEFNVIR